MKIFRIIIWTGFLAILLVFIYYGRFFKQAQVTGIVSFELANPEKGKAILSGWDNAGLLSIALKMIWLDFLYIIFYVSIIITLSSTQIRKEPSVAINALLRTNFFFAALAGVFDIAENISLLYNIYNWQTSYISLRWLSLFKFMLIGWTLLIWLISFIKSKIK